MDDQQKRDLFEYLSSSLSLNVSQTFGGGYSGETTITIELNMVDPSTGKPERISYADFTIKTP